MLTVRHKVLATCACLIALVGLPTATVAQDAATPAKDTLRVIGYLPDYRLTTFDEAAARFVTDIVVFSAQAEKTGALDTKRLPAEQLKRLKLIKQQTRVGLILCVGGWGRSQGFAALCDSPQARQRFVEEATRFCLDQRFDGIDLDWEHPANEKEQKGYAQLLADLKAAFREHGLSVSVTMAAWQQLPVEAFRTVDTIQIMAYDHKGPHSTLEGAQKDLQTLIDHGAPAEKLVLGVPFYGRNLKNPDQASTYAEILRKHSPAPDVDEVAGIYFNGVRTIERKVQLARTSKLAGVMIWELGQDAPGDASLLRVIDRAKSSR